ncbi:unnamed protein product [Vitrella brassicaformis CCMP3155]|uniref:Replication protein A C-terminal domain-containing protein n=1 Tax=Vitrella brassicaformis (strain CCMP3155) TaxID=1169540 RepID=A0A0G4FX80_VITBC|nr:unnamed protein product [Vitrella brassicaformis CCMP3155]|eukprot:CEM19452.1 unnamed protein product [Vitrella brassicaformis CCMP3155]
MFFGAADNDEGGAATVGGYEERPAAEAFSPSPGGGGYHENRTSGASPSSGGGSGDSYKRRLFRSDGGLMPVTIRMVHEAEKEGNKVLINEKEISQVKIVGIVRELTENKLTTTWKVADYTGGMECRFYFPSSEAKPQYIRDRIAATDQHTMVKVYGAVKFDNKQNKRYLSVLQIKPVDIHEEMYHLVQVAHTHLTLTGTKLEQSADHPMSPAPAQIKREGGGTAGGTFARTSGASGGGGGLPLHRVPENITERVQRAVGAVVVMADKGSGVKKDFVVQRLAQEGFGAQEVLAAISTLFDEGEVFETIDDEHIQASFQPVN